MPFPPSRWGWPCQLPDCARRAWRSCLWCRRWACVDHRWGYHWFWLCDDCHALPAALELRSAVEQESFRVWGEERRRRRRENARHRAAVRCDVCGALYGTRPGRELWPGYRQTLWIPACACVVPVRVPQKRKGRSDAKRVPRGGDRVRRRA